MDTPRPLSLTFPLDHAWALATHADDTRRSSAKLYGMLAHLGRSSVLSAPVQHTREAESEAKRTQGITPGIAQGITHSSEHPRHMTSDPLGGMFLRRAARQHFTWRPHLGQRESWRAERTRSPEVPSSRFLLSGVPLQVRHFMPLEESGP